MLQVMFQYIVRHCPLKIEHLFASLGPLGDGDIAINDVEMVA